MNLSVVLVAVATALNVLPGTGKRYHGDGECVACCLRTVLSKPLGRRMIGTPGIDVQKLVTSHIVLRRCGFQITLNSHTGSPRP
jgi:hypothetical protein